MSGFVGVVVSDPSLQGQFTQVELRSLKAKVMSESAGCFFVPPSSSAPETAVVLRLVRRFCSLGNFCFAGAAVRVSEERFRPCHH